MHSASITAPPPTRSREPSTGRSFFSGLRAHGGHTALIGSSGEEISYAELADRVDDASERLGATRRLVLVEAQNRIESIVAYLACLSAGHPVVVSGPTSGPAKAILRAFDPDVVIGNDGDTWATHERRAGSRHALHPDLAALIPTSGSTGTPKLVRLSSQNLSSNASAIASFLQLDQDERAITSLPLHYCYGLSVLNSHLDVGASLVLNDASVVDRCFWDRFERNGATSFAAVPYTFDLLDRIGFGRDRAPSTLRTVTQAGGPLAPATVARYAALARDQGWRLVVMYGQTEATARMTYLPAELAACHPSSIGRPIPGGSMRLGPVEGAPDGEGELLYSGPNVMLGYATAAEDLASGRSIDELRTGDLGRRIGDGLFEITGRVSRFVKLFGVRIDLDGVERMLAADGLEALCAGSDEALRIAVAAPAEASVVQRAVAGYIGVPVRSVNVAVVEALPRFGSGKPDYRAVAELHCMVPAEVRPGSVGGASAVDDLFRSALGVERIEDDDTFVSLGGDSLSYVEVSLHLEDLVGHLPDGWHQRPVVELRELVADSTPSGHSTLETTVALRALAIVAVVAGHASISTWAGGGHLLLAVAGYNTARFVLQGLDQPGRVRRGLNQLGRLAVPAVVYMAGLSLIIPGVHVSNIALFSSYSQAGTWRYRLWFVESVVQIIAVVLGLLCIPAVRRAERRAPFGFALLVAVSGLALRQFHVSDDGFELLRTHAVVWIVALGWAAERADTVAKRVIVSVASVVAFAGWYDGGAREIAVAVGLILLAWVPVVPWPARLRRPVATVASASYAIYLLQWLVVDVMSGRVPPIAVFVVALGGGVLIWKTGEVLRVAKSRNWWSHPHARRASRFSGQSGRARAPGAGPSRTLVPMSTTENEGIWTLTRPTSGSST